MWHFSDPPNNDTVEVPIDGPFTNWDTICTNFEDITCNDHNQVCIPTEDLGRIQRCIGGTESMLPSVQEVTVALMEQSYDTEPYNKSDEVEGFRNALEGFTMLVNRDMDVCLNFGGGFRYTELHNRVHIYIGGSMQSVPQPSNDPIFFLHYCTIVRLYKEWLDQYSDDSFPSYKPSTFNYGIGPSQNIDEYLVPIFPLMTNEEMHTRATSLGYMYKETQSLGPPQDSGCMGQSQISVNMIMATLGLPFPLVKIM